VDTQEIIENVYKASRECDKAVEDFNTVSEARSRGEVTDADFEKAKDDHALVWERYDVAYAIAKALPEDSNGPYNPTHIK